jgi:hypothetical protein
MEHVPEFARLQQRGGKDQRLSRVTRDVTHGPARFEPQRACIGCIVASTVPGAYPFFSLVQGNFNPQCWFGGNCNDRAGLTALALRLDEMVQSLAQFAETTTLLFENQQKINDQVANSLKLQSDINNDIIRVQREQQAQIDVLKSQVNMLRASVDVLVQRQVEQGITFSRLINELQSQVLQLVSVMDQINNVTQAQIGQHTIWIRSMVRSLRQTQADAVNLVLKSQYKADVIVTFFQLFNLTNATLIQPYLTSSEFQGPNPDLLPLYTTIDTLTVQYTYQEDPLSPVTAVSSQWAYKCRNAFILGQPRLGVNYIDLLEYFGPERCVETVSTNNTCQCYWTVTTFTAPVADNGAGAKRPFPYGFPVNRQLDCRPFQDDPPHTQACAGPITSFTDPLNQNPVSIANLVYSVGSYSTMILNSSINGLSETVQNPSTSMFDVLRKLCYQQFQGKVLPLLGHGPDWTVDRCSISSNAVQPCFDVNATFPRFIFGPNQANSALRYTDPGFNFTTRMVSTLLNTYWDMPSVTNVDDCPLGTSQVGLELSFQTNKLYLYTVFFYALQVRGVYVP